MLLFFKRCADLVCVGRRSPVFELWYLITIVVTADIDSPT